MNWVTQNNRDLFIFASIAVLGTSSETRMGLKKSKGKDPVLLHVKMPSYDALSLFQHFVLKTT